MEKKRCYGCMKMKTQTPVCEHCGFNEYAQNESHQLPFGTVLNNQYLVGKSLGQGGFGITYLGWDQFLDIPVAIKEYYPNGFVARDCRLSLEVTICENKAGALFQSSRERFMREAQTLAKLSNVPGVVHVRNFFMQHNTAYIVMEYIKGIDLRRYMNMHGGRLGIQETLKILRPIMEAMITVHKAGIVHRDISPDNIMILPDGSVKLLDFGAVRNVESEDAEQDLPKSTEAILKHGFAPIEQYQRRGALGPWTDVYALCANVFYCATGKIPPDAPDRMMEELPINWGMIPGLTERQLAALDKGMAIRAKERYATVDELYADLYAEGSSQPDQLQQYVAQQVVRPSQFASSQYASQQIPKQSQFVSQQIPQPSAQQYTSYGQSQQYPPQPGQPYPYPYGPQGQQYPYPYGPQGQQYPYPQPGQQYPYPYGPQGQQYPYQQPGQQYPYPYPPQPGQPYPQYAPQPGQPYPGQQYSQYIQPQPGQQYSQFIPPQNQQPQYAPQPEPSQHGAPNPAADLGKTVPVELMDLEPEEEPAPMSVVAAQSLNFAAFDDADEEEIKEEPVIEEEVIEKTIPKEEPVVEEVIPEEEPVIEEEVVEEVIPEEEPVVEEEIIEEVISEEEPVVEEEVLEETIPEEEPIIEEEIIEEVIPEEEPVVEEEIVEEYIPEEEPVVEEEVVEEVIPEEEPVVEEEVVEEIIPEEEPAIEEEVIEEVIPEEQPVVEEEIVEEIIPEEEPAIEEEVIEEYIPEEEPVVEEEIIEKAIPEEEPVVEEEVVEEVIPEEETVIEEELVEEVIPEEEPVVEEEIVEDVIPEPEFVAEDFGSTLAVMPEVQPEPIQQAEDYGPTVAAPVFPAPAADPEPQKEPEKKQKTAPVVKEKPKSNKLLIPIIAGVAAVVAVAVLVLGGGKKDEKPTLAATEAPVQIVETQDPTEMPTQAPTEDVKTEPVVTIPPKPLRTGSVMKAFPVGEGDGSTEPAFGLDVEREVVTLVRFYRDQTYLGAVDISENKDGSVVAWASALPDGKYEINISGKDGVAAPENCDQLFSGFRSLTGIEFNDVFHTDGVKSMASMFAYCKDLADLDLSCFDTSDVTDMSNMFYMCTGLKSVNVSAFDTSRVTNMRGMFATGKNFALGGDSLSSLTSLDLSNFNTSKVTDMSSMFTNCDVLKSLNISSFDTSKVTNMSYMFYGCKALWPQLENFDFSNVTEYESFMDSNYEHYFQK